MKTLFLIFTVLLIASNAIARGRGGQPHVPFGGGVKHAPPPPVFVQPTKHNVSLNQIIKKLEENHINLIPVAPTLDKAEGLKKSMEYQYQGINICIYEFDSTTNANKKADYLLSQNSIGNYNWSIIRKNIVIVMGKEFIGEEVDRFRQILEGIK